MNENDAIKLIENVLMHEKESKIKFVHQTVYKINGEFSINATYTLKIVVKNFKK